MGVVKVRGREIQVDIDKEIQQFHWNRPKWSAVKLIACTPFRDEKNPSFAVSLETGVWIDSGSVDESWKSGGFVKLLAFLQNVTYEEAEEYLIDLYAPENWDVDTLSLTIKLRQEEEEPFLSLDELKPFAFRHPYLGRRGLSERTQRIARIGYDKESRAIVIPWFDYKDRLINYKCRSVRDKRFWYSEHGQRIRNHLYGLNFVYKSKRFDEVFIVESEIDALTLWEHGKAAVAMGGSKLTKKQKRLIRQAGIKKLIIATDNDEPGELAKKYIIEAMAGYTELEEVVHPEGRKDINDYTIEEINNIKTKPITFGFLGTVN